MCRWHANNVHLIVGTCYCSAANIQAQIDIVVNWLHNNFSPPSLSAMFNTVDIGLPINYNINGTPLISFKDMDVSRTITAYHAKHWWKL